MSKWVQWRSRRSFPCFILDQRIILPSKWQVCSRRIEFDGDDFFPRSGDGKTALAFLLGRFSGHVLKSGEHLVPEAALEALADQNIPFEVKGKATYEEQMAALRGPTPSSIQ